MNVCKKKEYKNKSLSIISKDTKVKAAITSSVSQRGISKDWLVHRTIISLVW